MKNLFKNFITQTITLAVIAFPLVSPVSTQAAIISASITDAVRFSTTNAESVSTDMALCPSIGTGTDYLSVIAYADAPTASVNISVKYGGFTPLNFNLPSAWMVDVAILDDYISPGSSYIIGVAYNDPNGAGGLTISHFAAYRISGIGTGSMTQSLLYNVVLPSSAANTSTKYPRIDAFTDPSILVGGVPSMHEFLIIWVDGAGSTHAQHRDIDQARGTAGVLATQTLSASQGADVAATTDINTGNKYGYIIRATATPGLVVDEWDISGAVVTSSTMTSPTGMAQIDLRPRIEAMNQHDPGAGWVRWQSAVGIRTTVGFSTAWHVYGYNDLSTIGTNLSVGISGGRAQVGYVAAGIGGPGNAGNIGNTDYTVIWYDFANANNYAKYMNASAGTYSADEYEMNCSGCASPKSGGGPLAVTNSSNDGYDIHTTWYDGADILYKNTGNALSYKPTSVSQATINNKINIYPNPASDVLNITNAEGGHYIVINVAGQTISSGEIKNEMVDLSGLENGTYTIQVLNQNKQASAFKFIKQ